MLPWILVIFALCFLLERAHPRWVGYFFQRPEMHRIHHQRDYHKNNYGDVVWWDMLFGTYENPPTWDDAREELP